MSSGAGVGDGTETRRYVTPSHRRTKSFLPGHLSSLQVAHGERLGQVPIGLWLLSPVTLKIAHRSFFKKNRQTPGCSWRHYFAFIVFILQLAYN